MRPTAAVVRSCPACGALRSALPPAIAAALPSIPALTPREREVFDLLGRGYDNRSIAFTLEISERTAKRHITAILDKLKLESRLQAGLTALVGSYAPDGVEAHA